MTKTTGKPAIKRPAKQQPAKQQPHKPTQAELLLAKAELGRGTPTITRWPPDVLRDLHELLETWDAMPLHLRPAMSEVHRLAKEAYAARVGGRFPTLCVFSEYAKRHLMSLREAAEQKG